MELKPDPERQRGILLVRATALAALLQHRAGHAITKHPLCAQARIVDVLVVELDGMSTDEILIGLVIESPVLVFAPDHHEATGLPFIVPPFLQANASDDPLDLDRAMPDFADVMGAEQEDASLARTRTRTRPSTWPQLDPGADDAGLIYTRVLVLGRDLFGEIQGFVDSGDPTDGVFVKFEHPYDQEAAAERVDFDRCRVPPPVL